MMSESESLSLVFVLVLARAREDGVVCRDSFRLTGEKMREFRQVYNAL
jgi:hypothetical protein